MSTTGLEPFDTDALPEPDRWWPMKLTATVTYIVWELAATAEEARANISNDPPQWEPGEADWDGPDIETPSPYEIAEDYRFGPHQACDTCGAIESTLGTLEDAAHRGTCPHHRHHPTVTPVYADRESLTPSGWITRCSCQTPGFDTSPGYRSAADNPPGTLVYPTREAAAIPLREHVKGRRHGRNHMLGITAET